MLHEREPRKANRESVNDRATVTQPLAGRAVLVTGASSGIGRAIAVASARAGADVALTYLSNEQGARDVAREIEAVGRRAAVFQTDIAEASSVRTLGPSARAALGRLDVWVNNAGADILTGAAASLGPVESWTCCSQWTSAAPCWPPGRRPTCSAPKTRAVSSST